MAMKERLFVIGVLTLTTLLALPVVFVIVGMQTTGGTGSMAEAVKLRPLVEAMPPPAASFANRDTETVGLVFPNGEWVVGITKDSHAWFSAYFGGGTVVLKDSRGRVRCFFGHVCGVGNFMMPREMESLDEFDANLPPILVEQPWL